MNDQAVLKRLFTVLEEYYTRQHEGDFVDYKSPSELRSLLALDRPDSSGNWEAIFTWVDQYLKYGVKTAQPAFINRMWAGANLPSMLGEMVVAISNTSACTYESAPVSTLIEQYMISQMLEVVGFSRGEGQMTTGSSNANMIAMMCARNLACQGLKNAGLFGQPKMYALVNCNAHYSMDKAANILGIGSDQLIKVAVDERGAMRPQALEEELTAIVAEGGIPFFVTATAGTTVRGAYDPIEPLLALRRKYHFWLHVDGAWGGAAVMSERLRAIYLRGLEQADSFTFDFHKMLGSSLICNVLLVAGDNHPFGTVLAGGDGSYLFRDTDENDVQDLGSVSLQCGRRVDSLKWFLDWKYYGREGFARRIENYLSLCEYAEQRLDDTPELELVVPRTSFNLCFRFRVPEPLANGFNQELRTRLYKRGRSLIGLAYVDDKLIMRLLVANTAVGRREIDAFLAEVVEMGREMLAEGLAG